MRNGAQAAANDVADAFHYPPNRVRAAWYNANAPLEDLEGHMVISCILDQWNVGLEYMRDKEERGLHMCCIEDEFVGRSTPADRLPMEIYTGQISDTDVSNICRDINDVGISCVNLATNHYRLVHTDRETEPVWQLLGNMVETDDTLDYKGVSHRLETRDRGGLLRFRNNPNITMNTVGRSWARVFDANYLGIRPGGAADMCAHGGRVTRDQVSMCADLRSKDSSCWRQNPYSIY